MAVYSLVSLVDYPVFHYDLHYVFTYIVRYLLAWCVEHVSVDVTKFRKSENNICANADACMVNQHHATEHFLTMVTLELSHDNLISH